jgi:hypothetical protein
MAGRVQHRRPIAAVVEHQHRAMDHVEHVGLARVVIRDLQGMTGAAGGLVEIGSPAPLGGESAYSRYDHSPDTVNA